MIKKILKWSLLSSLALFVIAIIFADGDAVPVDNKESNTAAVSPITQPSYTIISDESKRNIKRTIKASLKDRTDVKELERMAHELKSQEAHAYERTFIAWLIEGEDRSYWARTDFNPDLKVSILGPTAEQYNYLINLDPVIDGEKLGSWIEPTFGDASHRVIGYKKGDKVYFNEYYLDKSSSNKEYKQQNSNGIVGYKPDAENLSYLIINKRGELEYWHEGEKNKTLKPI